MNVSVSVSVCVCVRVCVRVCASSGRLTAQRSDDARGDEQPRHGADGQHQHGVVVRPRQVSFFYLMVCFVCLLALPVSLLACLFVCLFSLRFSLFL